MFVRLDIRRGSSKTYETQLFYVFSSYLIIYIFDVQKRYIQSVQNKDPVPEKSKKRAYTKLIFQSIFIEHFAFNTMSAVYLGIFSFVCSVYILSDRERASRSRTLLLQGAHLRIAPCSCSTSRNLG